jgi:hypothetical protein
LVSVETPDTKDVKKKNNFFKKDRRHLKEGK